MMKGTGRKKKADTVLIYLLSIHIQVVQKLRPCAFVPDLQNFDTCSNITNLIYKMKNNSSCLKSYSEMVSLKKNVQKSHIQSPL